MRFCSILAAIGCLLPLASRGEVLANPAITAATPGADANFTADNVFDSEAEAAGGEYKTNAGGVNTFIDFDFGSTVAVDGFVNVTRESNTANSKVANSRLVFDTDGVAGFDAATDTVVEFTPATTGERGQGFINRFPKVSARKVRWQVLSTQTGTNGNTGAMEMRFLRTPAGAAPIAGVAATGGAAALNGTLALANAANGVAGRTLAGVTTSPGVAYGSSGQGTATWVDFDLGQIQPVTGFDFFDNLESTQRVQGFDLVFSNTADFSSVEATRSYSGNSQFTVWDSFAAIPARYVRYKVTACSGANPGLSDIVFYAGSNSSLPGGFSATANPANGWLHGSKATAQAEALEAFEVAAVAGSAGIPCARWSDGGDEPAFAGATPAHASSVGWGTATADWEAGRFYHAWRGGHGFPVVSRFTVTKTGAYNLGASWRSHTVSGCAASVWIVVNGTTVANASVNGFAGTTGGTKTASGSAPVAEASALGLALAAGSTVDIVTVPVSANGNVAVTASVTETTVAAETTNTPVIREFCASNSGSLQDEDGESSDWIEIYNGTGASVNLSGWGLTDKSEQPKQWVFPSRVLGHGQRLVVFASGKDAAKRPGYGPASELHTNFSLSKGGEFLGLARPTGTYATSFGSSYPEQYDTLSYGMGSNGVTGFMTATPGAPNGAATAVPPALLTFSEPSGMLSSNKVITISGQGAQHTVRYTTDGSEPTLANGSTYSGPGIAVSSSVTLRARAFASGIGGPLALATYTRLGITVQYGITPASFASSLPLLVIDASASPPSDKTPVTARFTLIDRAADGKARLTGAPALTSRGTIKLRGQWSATFPKKGYGIEFWDEADRDRALEVLGMPKESDWTLYSAYQTDPDFLRNVLMYDLYRKMGRWAPRVRFVEVFFNTTAGSSIDGPDYHGIYVIREKIKVDSERVDIAKMTPSDNSGDAVTGGYIIAHDKYGNFEQTHPELLTGNRDGIPHWPYAGGGAFVYKTPSVTDITAAQKAYISDYVLQCDTAIASPGFRHPVTGLHYRDYIGRDSFIDHHMMMAFAKNVDAIRISTYFEKDRGGKLRMSALWDNDLSQFAADAGSAGDNPATWNSDVPVSSNNTDYFSVDGHTAEGWFHYLHQDPGYLQEWVDRYDRWRTTGVLDLAAIHGIMDAAAAELTAADNGGIAAADSPVARNFARWTRATRGVTTNGGNAASVIFGSGASSEINLHKTWLAQRLAFMDSWVLKKPVASLAPGTVAAGSMLQLTSPDLTGAAKIHYTLDGSDPLNEDGTLAAGAQEWTGPLTLSTTTVVTARLYQPSPATPKHRPWSAPLVAGYAIGAQPAAAGNLAVSELMYHPADPTAEEVAAGFTDPEDFEFIELRNMGSSRINLWNARFTEGIKFTFPVTLDASLAELEPGEVVLLVSRAEAFAFRYGAAAAARVAGTFDGGDHLANSGERLLMVDAAGATILDFSYSDDEPWPVVADGGGLSLHYLGGAPGEAEGWLAHAVDPGVATGDLDGDGQSDTDEWLAGSDPTNAAEVFRMTAGTSNGGGSFTASFPVVAGHRYRVERSEDLVHWVDAEAEFVAAASGQRTFTTTLVKGAPAFFRAVAIARP